MRRMLERIGLNASFDVLPWPEYLRKIYIPLLDKPPEGQEWDLHTFGLMDWSGHTGLSFLPWNYIEETHIRWIGYDPVYEEIWKDMIKTVGPKVEEEKIQNMVRHLY